MAGSEVTLPRIAVGSTTTVGFQVSITPGYHLDTYRIQLTGSGNSNITVYNLNGDIVTSSSRSDWYNITSHESATATLKFKNTGSSEVKAGIVAILIYTESAYARASSGDPILFANIQQTHLLNNSDDGSKITSSQIYGAVSAGTVITASDFNRKVLGFTG